MRTSVLVMTAAVSALALSACSDAKQTVAPVSTTQTAATQDVVSSNTDPTSVPTATLEVQPDITVDRASAPGADSDFCNAITALSSTSDSLDEAYSSEDGVASKAVIDKFLAELVTLKAVAPAELQTDVELVNKGFNTLAEMLIKTDYDIAAAMSDPANSVAIQSFDGEEVNAAGDRIDAYSETQCGFTVSD